MIKLSINVQKINKNRLIKGKKGGVYLDAVLFENKNGTDEFQNDGFIAENVTKEERLAGTKGNIIGNWKHLVKKQTAPKPADGNFSVADDDGTPF